MRRGALAHIATRREGTTSTRRRPTTPRANPKNAQRSALRPLRSATIPASRGQTNAQANTSKRGPISMGDPFSGGLQLQRIHRPPKNPLASLEWVSGLKPTHYPSDLKLTHYRNVQVTRW